MGEARAESGTPGAGRFAGRWAVDRVGPSDSSPELASLPDRARAALGDPVLQQALSNATGKFMAARRTALAGFPQGEAYRERARQIKEATLQRLDEYLEQLSGNVERAGGVVHWARDAAEARAIVLELARARGVRTVVIELTLTRGVHGPREVHAVFVDAL